jgi:AraC-like DNA-binding protein
MSAMMTWGRALSGHKFPLIEARFSFPATHYHEHFLSIFGNNTTFEMSENCLIFDSQLLKLPIINGNQFLKYLIEDKAKSALQAMTNVDSVTTKTKIAIEKILLSKNTISIDAVCNELATSRQTLYRKLKEEGSDYKSLSDEYKKSAALKLLQKESENITSISLRLGYKDTSSFYKAFKRWFGITPKAYLNSFQE